MSQPVHPTQGNSDTTPDTTSAPDAQVLTDYLDYDEPQGFDPLTSVTRADAQHAPVVVEYDGMRKEVIVGLDAALDRVEALMLEGFTVHSVRFAR